MDQKRWTDRIVGERMAVDREFNDRVEQSEFSRQEWGLIMTAVEFEIENPESEHAALVADTSKIPHILPELEKLQEQMSAAGAAPGGSSSSGGVFDSIKNALGLGSGGPDPERGDAASRLAQEYANELQNRLEENGKWEEVQSVASE